MRDSKVTALLSRKRQSYFSSSEAHLDQKGPGGADTTQTEAEFRDLKAEVPDVFALRVGEDYRTPLRDPLDYSEKGVKDFDDPPDHWTSAQKEDFWRARGSPNILSASAKAEGLHVAELQAEARRLAQAHARSQKDEEQVDADEDGDGDDETDSEEASPSEASSSRESSSQESDPDESEAEGSGAEESEAEESDGEDSSD